MGKTLLFIHGCDQESPPGVADDDARLREYICPENNEDIQRLEQLLEKPELFRRTPDGQKPPQ